MLTELLIFALGAIVGLATQRNQVVSTARMKALELLIELEAQVETWPKEGVPMQSMAEDREWRLFIERLHLWLVAARVPEEVAMTLKTSADAAWRGHPTNWEYTWKEGRAKEDGRDPYVFLVGYLLPVLYLRLYQPTWRSWRIRLLIKRMFSLIDSDLIDRRAVGVYLDD